MANTDLFNLELAWDLMTPMEQALYGTTFALHATRVEDGLAAADDVLARFRSVTDNRSRLPEPEYEAAKAGHYIEYEEFAVWYRVQLGIWHMRKSGYQPPTPKQTKEAYERHEMSRNDYY